MKNILVSLLVSIVVFLSSGHVTFGQDNSATERVAEKMLGAIGGRTAWADLKNTINGSQQNRVGEPTVVYAEITIDFERPRFRIETTAEDLHLIRVIDGDRHWRLNRAGKIEDVPADLLSEDLKWYAAHLYRTIHRVAARDPAISLDLNDQERLEVFVNGKRILWFAVDAKGEPYAFGAYNDNVGSLTGPWNFVQDGIRHPAWVSSSDGTWRAGVKSLSVNVPLHSHMFARPDSKD